MKQALAKNSTRTAPKSVAGDADPLMVLSVEKAFRVLSAFDAQHQTLSLTQVAQVVDLDKSAAQRFTHTLMKLGYLFKDPETKRFELTAKTLDLAYHYTRATPLIERAMPVLKHISKETEEAVNLTMLDDTDVIFVARVVSRHVLNMDVVIGTRMPAYCSATGVAILSRLPEAEAEDILARSDLRAYTSSTVYKMKDIKARLKVTAAKGYSTSFEEFYHSDLSIAAAVLNGRGYPVAALSIAVSRARITAEEAEAKFAPIVTAAARSISQTSAR